MTPSNLFLGLGSSIAAGRSLQSAVGKYHIPIASLTGGGWLVSTVDGLGLVVESSSAGKLVKGEVLSTSTFVVER